MASATLKEKATSVVTVLDARANFGKLLDRADTEQRSIVIHNRGTPRAVLLSIRDYVRLAAPEPEILRLIGKESEGNGTSKLSTLDIDHVITLTRSARKKR